jgi:hypothetical protein
MPVTRPDKFISEFPVDTLSKFSAPGILLLLTLAFGVWLSLSGKPYNGVLFNIHKLVALGSVIVTVIQFSQLLKGTQLQVLPILLFIVAGLCVVALFFTGAMMSAGKLDYHMMLAIHRIALILLTVMMAVTLYLLIGRKL